MKQTLAILAIIAVAISADVATAQGTPSPAPVAVCNTCGVVESVRYVQKQGEASGLGAAIRSRPSLALVPVPTPAIRSRKTSKRSPIMW